MVTLRFQQWLHQLLYTVYACEWVYLEKMTGKCQQRETKLWPRITKGPQRDTKEWEINYSKEITSKPQQRQEMWPIRELDQLQRKKMGTKQPQKHKNNIKDTSNDTQKKTQNDHKSFVMTLHDLVTGCVHTVGSFMYLKLPVPRSLSTCHWGVFFFS